MEAKKNRLFGKDSPMYLPDAVTVTPADAMIKVFKWLVSAYSSSGGGGGAVTSPEAVAAKAYVLSTGITESEIDMIRRLLLVTP